MDTDSVASGSMWTSVSAWSRARPWKAALLAGIGSCLTILLLAVTGDTSGWPLLIAPFGASCALVFGAPASPFAHPRRVIGGHLISAAFGLLATYLIADVSIAMAVGVGLAIAGMMLTDTMHPPAGANPIVIGLTQPSIDFLMAPVLVGSVTVVLLAMAYRRRLP